MRNTTKVTVSRALLTEWPILAWSQLSRNEFKCACLASKGFKNRQIADQLNLTMDAVKANLRRACKKLGVRGKVELAVAAWRNYA